MKLKSPKVKGKGLNSEWGRQTPPQRWCDTCQAHYTGNLIVHRRSTQHKMCKQQGRPFCPVCKRHFRTPRKFVEHMKSAEHKQQVQLEESQEEELITLDAVGCFEEEEEVEVAEEGQQGEDEEESEMEDSQMEEVNGQEYDPHVEYASMKHEEVSLWPQAPQDQQEQRKAIRADGQQCCPGNSPTGPNGPVNGRVSTPSTALEQQGPGSVPFKARSGWICGVVSRYYVPTDCGTQKLHQR
ncbi:Cip1-interacting zinc finger protein [Oryzias melastigma]|uniref:Cip1-interacting zinc finger protein n=1 Tax=Oryzias melastigma TaxID=30732 RepID=A0A834BWN2_ORYME|nr:Cip1-interacting zinc finger protein [Oryzias melastigma]